VAILAFQDRDLTPRAIRSARFLRYPIEGDSSMISPTGTSRKVHDAAYLITITGMRVLYSLHALPTLATAPREAWHRVQGPG
jgi:hypothetical protein